MRLDVAENEEAPRVPGLSGEGTSPCGPDSSPRLTSRARSLRSRRRPEPDRGRGVGPGQHPHHPFRPARRRRTRRLGDAPERRSGPARRGTAGPDRSGPVLVHSRIVEEALQRTCLCRRVGVLGLSVRCRLPRPERRGHPDPGWQTISTAQPLSLTGDGAKQMKKVVALYFDAKLNQMLIPSVWNPPGPLAANPYLEAPIVGTSSSTPSAGSTCAAPSPASRSPVRSRRRAGRSRHRTWCSRGRRLSSSWPRRSPRGQASGEPVGRAQPVKAGVASAPTAGLADTVTVADAVAENGTPGSV